MAGQEATVTCTVDRAQVRPTRRRNLKIVEAQVSDDSGSRVTAIWFNQAYLAEQLRPGTRLLLHGRLESSGYGPATFRVERHERAEAGAGLHTIGLVPVYPASEELATGRLREIADQALALGRFFRDPLPAALAAEEEPSVPRGRDPGGAPAAGASRGRGCAATSGIPGAPRPPARPTTAASSQLRRAPWRRPGRGRRADRALPKAPSFHADARAGGSPQRDQRRISRSRKPMQRLLQGDVGSGKTVVALYALLRAVEAGHQGALMAPTETLAEQHFLTVEPICNDLGVRVQLLTSSLGAAEATRAREAFARGEADLAIGTHALIQESVAFRSLAVAVVDEQHRFGVEQRRALGSTSPHVLHMTATPIPRTLAQTVYGDLEVTEIARPPRDRKPIVTRWVTEERSGEAYERLRRPPGRGAAGLRRLPARFRVGGDRGACRGTGGRAAAAGRALGLPGRLSPRAAQGPGAPRRS